MTITSNNVSVIPKIVLLGGAQPGNSVHVLGVKCLTQWQDHNSENGTYPLSLVFAYSFEPETFKSQTCFINLQSDLLPSFA